MGSDAATPPSWAPSGCAQTVAGWDVVACGLAPTFALIGVDDSALYAVSGDRAWMRIDRSAGTSATVLFQSLSFRESVPRIVPASLAANVVRGGTIYLVDAFVTPAKRESCGILGLSTSGPSTPTVLLDYGVYDPAGFVMDGDFAYFSAPAASGQVRPIVRANLATGVRQTVSPTQGAPFAVHGGFLYFVDVSDAVRRVPVSGGSATEILHALPTSTARGVTSSVPWTDLAVDDAYLYVPFPSSGVGPHRIMRFSVLGGDTGMEVASIPSPAEIPVAAPQGLLREGDYLYFVGGGLRRVRRDGSEAVETLGESEVRPLFDATSIYATRQRGGRDAPLEGIVVRRAK